MHSSNLVHSVAVTQTFYVAASSAMIIGSFRAVDVLQEPAKLIPLMTQ